MAWRIEFARSAEREFAKLDEQTAARILRFLRDRVAVRDDPRSLARPLKGQGPETYWRFRVGDYRLLTVIEDDNIRVLVLRIGHRREVYDR